MGTCQWWHVRRSLIGVNLGPFPRLCARSCVPPAARFLPLWATRKADTERGAWGRSEGRFFASEISHDAMRAARLLCRDRRMALATKPPATADAAWSCPSLVGWQSILDDPVLRTSAAYHLAFETAPRAPGRPASGYGAVWLVKATTPPRGTGPPLRNGITLAGEMAGVVPSYTTRNGQDAVSDILSSNVNRRHRSKSQRVMARVMTQSDETASHLVRTHQEIAGLCRSIVGRHRSTGQRALTLAKARLLSNHSLEEIADEDVSRIVRYEHL